MNLSRLNKLEKKNQSLNLVTKDVLQIPIARDKILGDYDNID